MKANRLFLRSAPLFAALLLTAFGCQPADKKAELADLRKQKAEIETKIAALEKEVGSDKPAAETRVTAVMTQPVQPQTFRHFVEVQGTVDSDNNIGVTPKMGGSVTRVLVKEGDNVRAGQVLLTTDDATLRQSLAQLQTGYELAKTTFERQQNLWNQKIGSEIQYLQAKAQRESLERQIATLNTQLAMTRVTSPISGTVNAVNVKIGEMAAPGMPVVQVVNLTNMKVTARVADSYINSIKKGDPVVVKLPDVGAELTGRLTFVGQVVNPMSRTFDIEVALPNKGGMLKPNLLATVSINDKTKPNALVIDENLIQKTEAGDIVFVTAIENGKTVAKSRKITKGLAYNGKVEVTAGLAPGDQLVTVGNQDLVDGQPVKIQAQVAVR